jgi:ribonuclease BN (tRNA processing enzyme)
MVLFAIPIQAPVNSGLSALLPSTATQIVFLGTGTPNPDPDHEGPATAIVVNGQPYIVDAGPGVVRQAAAAHLKMNSLTKVFITHLHSDHTLGLPDLMYTPALTGRTEGLSIYGPKGIRGMVSNVQRAWREDREIRFHGGEPSVPAAYKMDVREITEGIVYKDSNVTVKSFRVNHGKWKWAFGYRFETPDRVIVISGDTTYSPNLIKNAVGCDVLIHEVYSAAGLAMRTPDWIAYHSAYHTSGPDLARIADQVRPKILFLYHELPFRQPPGEILEEVRRGFKGDVREARDLDSF